MKVKRKVTLDTYDFKVGDVISFKLTTDEKVRARAVKKTKDGMLFITVDCLKKEYPMFNNTEGMENNEISYNNSDLRKALNNEILSTFPNEIRDHMIEVYETDLLRIPEQGEIFGKYCFEAMKDRRKRIAFRGNKSNEWEWYWLINKAVDSASYFAGVSGSGYAAYYGASISSGVRPVFCLS